MLRRIVVESRQLFVLRIFGKSWPPPVENDQKVASDENFKDDFGCCPRAIRLHQHFRRHRANPGKYHVWGSASGEIDQIATRLRSSPYVYRPDRPMGRGDIHYPAGQEPQARQATGRGGQSRLSRHVDGVVDTARLSASSLIKSGLPPHDFAEIALSSSRSRSRSNSCSVSSSISPAR